MKILSSHRIIAFLLIQFFVWVKVFGFAPISLNHSAEEDTNLYLQSAVSAHDECIVQTPTSTEKSIPIDSHNSDFIESEEEKSERKSGLDFFPVLFVGFLIDYLFSEASLHTLLLDYSGFIPFHSVAIFLLDCVFLI